MPTRTVYRSAERKPAVRLTAELQIVILELLHAGHSQNQIARQVGCSQHLVHKVATGKLRVAESDGGHAASPVEY